MKPTEKPEGLWKKVPFTAMGIIVVLAVMLLLLWNNVSNSMQSEPAFFPDIYFEGQYKLRDGEWKPIVKGQHIPATKGDVTLEGQFHMTFSGGEYLGVAEPGIRLAFYTNHIHLTVQEQGQEPFVFDIESAVAGRDLCGEVCTAYTLMSDQPVTLTFHNNHRFGNENAIDEFLKSLAIYADSSFGTTFMDQGNAERNVGLACVIIAFVLLGVAIFSSLMQVEGGSMVWVVGLAILFAGGYFIYGAKGVSFWSESVIGNTTILGLCMMLYMLSVCALMVSAFNGKLRKLAIWTVALLGAGCTAIALFCLLTDVCFYDTWLWWAVLQSVANGVLLICLAFEFFPGTRGKRIGVIGSASLLLGFEADFVGTALGWWQGGLVSSCIFMILLVISLMMVWQIIPRNIKAARRAKEMEAEQKEIRAQLQENRIAIMISQIQPHFIYNTLGTIQQLCKEDPEQAAKLVHNFSVYLRGNFSELDNTAPIRFAKELEHVHCYTEIELIRFPDMAVRYDIQTEEFLLPALSVQPLVENAIKHGLMGLEEGGTVTVTAFETATHYCVKVVDDGVGFDTTALWDERKHIGIRNVRERLEVMCGGTLTVESQPGKGTTATIRIPKEGKKHDRDSSR